MNQEIEAALRLLQEYLGDKQKLVITRNGADVYGDEQNREMDTLENVAAWLIENKESEG